MVGVGAVAGAVPLGRGAGFALGCGVAFDPRGAVRVGVRGCSCAGGLFARQPELEHATEARQAKRMLALAAA